MKNVVLLVLFQVTEDLRGDMGGLQFSGLRAVNVSGLGQNLKYCRPEAFYRGFIPNRHIRVAPPAVVQVVTPVFVQQHPAEDAVLISDYQIQKISQELAVLYGSGQNRMSCDSLCASRTMPQSSGVINANRLRINLPRRTVVAGDLA